MDYRFPYHDDPPAPQEPPQIHTPLSPPRPRLNAPSSNRPNAPADSHPQASQSRTIETTRTSSPGDTDSKTKSRTRTSHSAKQLLNSTNAHVSPPTSVPHTGPNSLTLTRRGTVSVASVMERCDSADVDSRSMISSLLDAYCRSDDAWDDDASEAYSDETATLDYLASPSSACTFRCRRGSSSTIVASELPPKRPKPTTLLIEAPPQSTTAAPRSAPVAKNMRPLPPLPPSQRSNVRPLPCPPSRPPPYAPVVNDNLSSTSIPAAPSVSSSRQPSTPASATSSSNSTSFVSVSSASTGLSKSTDKPMISKYHLLPPLLTIPASPSSQQPSPLPPDIPVPPSPMTARRHQATKLTQILGEQISPELLGPNGVKNQVHRLPTPPPVSTARTAKKQHQSNTKVPNEVSLAPTRGIQTRAVRPHAIYALDDTSEGSDIGYSLKKAESEHVSLFDFTDRSEENARKLGIRIDLSVEESDDTGSSDAGEIFSPSDSILEEVEDMEEARIGWALQNVITYQKAARVKRTSRMWVLEKNGQRWEEQDHTNIRRALRQLQF